MNDPYSLIRNLLQQDKRKLNTLRRIEHPTSRQIQQIKLLEGSIQYHETILGKDGKDGNNESHDS